MNLPHKNSIDQLFQDGLHNRSVTPPADMWNRIQNGLSEEPKNRKKYIFIFLAAAGTMFAAIVSAYFLFSEKPGFRHTNYLSAKTTTAPATTPPVNIPQFSEKHLQKPEKLAKKPIKQALGQAITRIPTSINPIPTRLYTALLPFPSGLLPEKSPASEMAFGSQKTDDSSVMENTLNKNFYSARKPVRNKRKWRVQTGMTSGSSLARNTSFSTANGSSMLRQSNAFGRSHADISPEDLIGLGSAANLSNPESSSLQTDNALYQQSNLAFSFGFRIGYVISKRIELQSGIAFNRWTGKVNNFYSASSREFTLSFFEIPLLIKYNFVAHKKGNFYLTAGPTSQVYLSYKAKESSERSSAFYTAEKPRLQNLNLHTSMGAEWKLGKQFALHIEPGIRIGGLSNLSSSIPDINFNLYTGLSCYF